MNLKSRDNLEYPASTRTGAQLLMSGKKNKKFEVRFLLFFDQLLTVEFSTRCWFISCLEKPLFSMLHSSTLLYLNIVFDKGISLREKLS
jgi:hypothetical protein